MLSEPKFVDHPSQPYAAIRLTLEQSEVAEHAPPLIEEIIGWVASRGEQTGPVFFNYTRMEGSRMAMEVGAPTATLLAGDGRVVADTLPAGRYVTVTHTGPYDQLRAAHELLHEWLAKQGLPPQGMGPGRSTLLEIYHTDPSEEPDPSKWVTEIAFRLGD
jgi:effector-binding domain-containing protein